MKRLLTTITLLSSLFVVSFSSHSASFDCDLATTKSEKYICSNPKISSLDSVLAETYKEAIKVNPNLKIVQKDWNTDVRDRLIGDGDEEQIIEAYREQIDFLLNMSTAEPTKEESTKSTTEPTKEEPKKQTVENIEGIYRCWDVEKYTIYRGHKSKPETHITKIDTLITFEKQDDGAVFGIKHYMDSAEIRMSKNDDGYITKDPSYIKSGYIYKAEFDGEDMTFYQAILENRDNGYLWVYYCHIEK